MASTNLITKDYVLPSISAPFQDDIINVICQRLHIHRNKYWANPNLGSKLYTLRRSKDVPRISQLAKQYVQEALKDLVPTRLQSFEVQTSQTKTGQLDIDIDITLLTGHTQTIQYFVAVGG